MAGALAVALTAAPSAAGDERSVEWADANLAALRELLEGPSGQREVWSAIPELVILTRVVDFSGPDMTTGHVATGDLLTAEDVAGLEADLTAALSLLTAGRLTAFAAVHHEALDAGDVAVAFRRGQIVVGRFRGVQARTGTLGFGGRTVRDDRITAGVVILDDDFDRQAADRRLLRTHELGHALGYNHVESRRSVMNPHIGVEVTDFDRAAVAVAAAGLPAPRPFALAHGYHLHD